MEVGGPEDRCPCSGADRIHINSISSKARGEDLAVDVELRRGIGSGILGDFLPDFCPLARVIPVEIERDEHLHAIVCSRLVGIAQLCVSVRVNADVEGKSVDAERLGPLHVRIEVCWAGAIRYDADLSLFLVLNKSR